MEKDRRVVLAKVSALKALFLQRKQSINWTLIQRDWDDYFKNQAPANWREEFMPLIRGVTVDANDMWTAELGIQFNVQNLFELAALEFEAYGMKFAQPALETTVSDLFALLKTSAEEGWTTEQLDNAIDRLWDVYLRDDALSDEERQWFVDRSPRYRVEMIARTETMHAANFGSTELFQAYGANQHEWITAQDDRVRPTHRAANGQIRTIGQPFEIGNSLMLYPLDGSLGADAGEIVNCRCVTVPVLEEMAAPGEMPVATGPAEGTGAWARQRLEEIPKEIEAELARLKAQGKEWDIQAQELFQRYTELIDLRRELELDDPERARLKTEGDVVLEQVEKLWNQSRDLMNKRIEMQQGQLESLRQVLYVDNPINVHIGWESQFRGKRRQAIKRGFEEFNKMVSLDSMRGRTIPTHAGGRGRSHATLGEIWLTTTARERSTIHELGHVIETYDGEIRGKAVEFLDHRTAGEEAEWLGDDYDKDEKARKDKFKSPYMGKDYGGRATEIVSMGLEYVWADPVGFARDDPEYFDFIYDLMRGR